MLDLDSTLAEKGSANPALCDQRWGGVGAATNRTTASQPLPTPRCSTATRARGANASHELCAHVPVHPALHGRRPSSNRRPYAPPASASAMRVASRQRLPRAARLGDPAPASPPPGPGARGAVGSGRGGVHGTRAAVARSPPRRPGPRPRRRAAPAPGKGPAIRYTLQPLPLAAARTACLLTCRWACLWRLTPDAFFVVVAGSGERRAGSRGPGRRAWSGAIYNLISLPVILSG